MKTLRSVSRYQLCKRLVAVFILILSACVSPALADNYPSRTVTFVIPFSAGSITDTVARWIANDLQHALHQTFIVENKPGAQGWSQVTTSRTRRRTATLCSSPRIRPNRPRRVCSRRALRSNQRLRFGCENCRFSVFHRGQSEQLDQVDRRTGHLRQSQSRQAFVRVREQLRPSRE